MIPVVLDPAAKARWVGFAALALALALVAVVGFGPRQVESAPREDRVRNPAQQQTGETNHGDWARGSVGEIESGRAFLELQDEWESRLTNKANAALREAFDDRVAVTVNLELSPRSEIRSGVHVPEGGLPPSLVETVAELPSRNEESEAPAVSDPGRAPAVGAAKNGVRRSRLRRDAAFRHDRVRTQKTDPSLYGRKTDRQLAPIIKRITASIVIDERILAVLSDAAAAKSAVVEIVENAIGYDELRGDRINEPVLVKFVAPTVTVTVLPGGLQPILGAAGGALVVTILVLVWWSMRRRNLPKASTIDDDVEPDPDQDLTPEQLAERMRAEIEKAIQADPRAVSRLIDDWLMERTS